MVQLCKLDLIRIVQVIALTCTLQRFCQVPGPIPNISMFKNYMGGAWYEASKELVLFPDPTLKEETGLVYIEQFLSGAHRMQRVV